MFIKPKISVLFILLISSSLFSQNYDNSWHCGFDNYIDQGVILSFTNDTIEIDTVTRDIAFIHTTGSICDSLGKLQYYTNGCKVFNYNHELMGNGEGLGGGDEFYNIVCRPQSGMRWRQGVLIIPMENNKYQMYHQNAMQDDTIGRPFVDIVYRSVIDMNENNGLGKVILKNDIILNTEIHNGNFAAVQHANGIDWWMILHQTESDSFIVFHIDYDGVKSKSIQVIGIPTTRESETIGQAKFTPNGKKFVHYDLITGVQIFDFNRGTGILSNPIHLPFWHNNNTGGVKAGGMAISPSSQYLYISSHIHLDQFDLDSDDIESSRIYIDSFDGFANPLPATFFQMQLAPNKKIYMSATNGVSFMHVINNPDSVGASCDFVQRGLILPAQNVFSMPYFPNYRLGADSSLIVATNAISRKTINLILSPNPVESHLYYEFNSNSKIEHMSIYNMSGKRLLIDRGNHKYVDLLHLSSGMYLFVITLEDGRKTSQLFVKI